MLVLSDLFDWPGSMTILGVSSLCARHILTKHKIVRSFYGFSNKLLNKASSEDLVSKIQISNKQVNTICLRKNIEIFILACLETRYIKV